MSTCLLWMGSGFINLMRYVYQLYTFYNSMLFCIIIDHRATYAYRIGNGHTPPILLHWATLKHSPEYLALAKINGTQWLEVRQPDTVGRARGPAQHHVSHI